MTKKQKISVLKKMLKYYQGELPKQFIWTKGMCSAFIHEDIQSRSLLANVPEITAYKPQRKALYGYWWSKTTKLGIRKRINAITETIKLLENG